MWSTNTDVAFTGSDDRVVVLNAASPNSRPLALEGTALAIWECARDGGSTEEIIARVAHAYGIEPRSIEHDVATFLDVLSDNGILVNTTTNRGQHILG